WASLRASGGVSDAVAEPASYTGSFNPFPALVIGVTGAAMSAHFQTYLFQVSALHALSGHVLTPRKGSDTCPLGLLPLRLRRPALPDLFLCLAKPPTFYSSLSSTVRGPCQFPPGVRRSGFH